MSADGRRAVSGWRCYEPLELHPILVASAAALQQNGYHGTTVREIARRVGLTMPTLYYHYGSKEGILSAMLEIAMDDLIAHVRGGVEEAAGDVHAELANIVTAVTMHVTKRRELAVLHTEYRFLGGEARSRYLDKRAEVRSMLDDTLERGAPKGRFDVLDARATGRAVLAMVQGVADWYRPDGKETPELVARDYVEFAFRLVRGPAAVPPSS